MSGFGWRRLAAIAAGVTVVASLAVAPVRAEIGRVIPVPEVEPVPADVGIRGGPHAASHSDPATFGYVEEEFFLEGKAKSYGAATEDAPYKTRLYVLRPEDPAKFNGTVLMEWNNVTGTIDASPVWYLAHEYLIRQGYIFAGVTAQLAGQQPSPLALKQHDPVRYGSLHHPGDDYSWDIFSQAGMAVLAGDPSPVAGYPVERLIGVGQSQSGGRLGTYLRDVHRHALRSGAPGNAANVERPRPHPHERRVFDGIMPMTAAPRDIPTDLGPIIWVNEVRSGHSQPDEGGFRLIEIAGAPHFTWWGFRAGQSAGSRNRHHALPADWDRESAAQYGERGGGPCPQGFFPDRFAYSAAIDHMDRWLRTEVAPKSWPRLDRTEGGTVVLDEHDNTKGGFRLPPLDVPVATYRSCGALFGETVPFDPAKMGELYPDHDTYVDKMKAAIDEAVADQRLLPEDAAELLERAEASQVGRGVVLLAGK